MEVGQYDGAASEGEHTLNQLLVEMDGMTSKEGVLMIASTNRAEVLDKVCLRIYIYFNLVCTHVHLTVFCLNVGPFKTW